MLEFWKTPYPFNDFLVFIAERKKKKHIKTAMKMLEGIGLNYYFQKKYEKYTIFCASSLQLFKTTDFQQTTVFSGVGNYKGDFIFGQHDLNVFNDYQDIGESIGIFTSICCDNEQMVITQDFFGCGILYYAKLDNSLLVSNRYHLLLLYLSWIGFKGEINFKKVIANMYSNTTFLAQNISSEMDICGTYQLPFDKEIIVNKYGWKIVDKECVKQSLKGCSASERIDLIECAKNEIIENVQVILQSNRFYKYVTDLSGGIDSRVVFASLLNIPGAKHIFEIFAKDVPGSNDLAIATGIKNYFDFNYYNEEGRSQHPLSLRENLDIWRSYFMGTYYRMGISAWSPRGDNIKQIRFSGGCGELYRTFWYKIYGEKINNTKSIDELAENLINTFSRLISPNQNYKKKLIEIISTELHKIQGQTLISKLDNHYLYFRNRYHFGMRAFEYYHDCPIWFPLMSKSLFKVAQSMSAEEKRDDALMLFLTKRLNESLVRIDYASMPLEKNEYLHSLGITPDKKIPLNTFKEDWEALQIKNRDKLLANRINMDKCFYDEWKNSDKIIVHELLNIFYTLKDINADFNSLFDHVLLDSIIKNINNSGFRNSIYAKLASIKDQIEIFN